MEKFTRDNSVKILGDWFYNPSHFIINKEICTISFINMT